MCDPTNIFFFINKNCNLSVIPARYQIKSYYFITNRVLGRKDDASG